jgi:hypothetical protein
MMVVRHCGLGCSEHVVDLASVDPRLRSIAACAQRKTIERGALLLSGPKDAEEDLVAPCSICGRIEASFHLPGTTGKFCWGCSADLATILVLTDEIDSAKLAGICTDELLSELSDISSRMLQRSQSADLGGD